MVLLSGRSDARSNATASLRAHTSVLYFHAKILCCHFHPSVAQHYPTVSSQAFHPSRSPRFCVGPFETTRSAYKLHWRQGFHQCRAQLLNHQPSIARPRSDPSGNSQAAKLYRSHLFQTSTQPFRSLAHGIVAKLFPWSFNRL